MRAGKLRHRVTIQQNTPTRDADGAELESWSDVVTVWAAIIPLSGRERFDNFGAQELAKRTHRIEIRRRSGITHKMRVVFGSRVFDIQEVRDIETRFREMHLMCEEVPSG